MCVDYVTEKFFLSYHYDMVPVTYGWANYTLYGPPGSYINALDFDSVEDLANYLLFLDANDDEYLKYFKWRENYIVYSSSMDIALCTVCRTLDNYLKGGRTDWEIQKSSPPRQEKKRYSSFRKWYESFPDGRTNEWRHIGHRIALNTTSVCIKPKEFPEFERWILGGASGERTYSEGGVSGADQ